VVFPKESCYFVVTIYILIYKSKKWSYGVSGMTYLHIFYLDDMIIKTLT